MDATMIHVYGITFPGATNRLLPGIDNTPVASVPVGSVVGLVTSHARPPEPTLENLVRHAEVVECVFAEQGVLPVRFGSAYADEQRIVNELSSREDSLRRRLDALDGCAELALRMEIEDMQSDWSACVTRARKLRELLDKLPGQLGPAVRDWDLANLGAGRATLLVERAAVAAVQEVVALEAADWSPAVMTVTGPWAPYSFSANDGEVAWCS